MKSMFILSVILIFSAVFSCQSESSTGDEKLENTSTITTIKEEKTMDELEDQLELAPDHSFPYNLDEPSEVIELPNKLKEISGLGIDETNNYLFAVQDETGMLFKINIQSKEIESEKEFNKEGDYEGVEWVNGKAYIIKSSGTLYEVTNFGQDNQETFKHKFDFHKDSDVEGLGYDAQENRLLISCKGKAGKGDKFEQKKGIYALDLATMEMKKEPVYMISVEAVQQFLEANNELDKLDKLLQLFQPNEAFSFGPSGVAVHPKTGDIYITSSVGKLLLVLHRNGKVKHIIKLKKKIHEQPEGITFASDGTLFISNEGKNGKGAICRFEYKEAAN